MDHNPDSRPSKPPLSEADRKRVNGELATAAILQRDDEAPPFRPRLKRRPEPRPLLGQEAAA
jgi:hypothetical protein